MTPQAEYGPDVFHPSDDDHDPDRVVRDAERNSRIARGAALAENVTTDVIVRGFYNVQWWGAHRRDEKGHRVVFYADTLADALIALAETVDNTNTQEK